MVVGEWEERREGELWLVCEKKRTLNKKIKNKMKEILILLSLSPKCQDYRYVPLCPLQSPFQSNDVAPSSIQLSPLAPWEW